MRDISHKKNTLRQATAQATLVCGAASVARIRNGEVPKGDPLEGSKIAAVLAAKRTHELLPYCHNIRIDYVAVDYELSDDRILVNVTVRTIDKTGVEMEALTAASIAALNIYDMLKMFDEAMEIAGVRLLEKKGGKSDFKQAFVKPARAAVVVISDSVSSGKVRDASGLIIRERLEAEGIEVADFAIIADEQETIAARLRTYADEQQLELVITTGGTGFSARDVTPEAMSAVIEREAPGVAEAARVYGQERTPYAMLSRGRAGIRGATLYVNLPGSSNGVRESLDALFPALLHSLKVLRAKGRSH